MRAPPRARHLAVIAAGIAACLSAMRPAVSLAGTPTAPPQEATTAADAPDVALLEFLSLIGDAEPRTLDLLFADVPLPRPENRGARTAEIDATDADAGSRGAPPPPEGDSP